MKALRFDGLDLEDYFFVERVSYDLPSLDVAKVDVPGMDGFKVTGTTTTIRPLTVRLTAPPASHDRLRDVKRVLAKILGVDGPRKLSTPEDEGKWRWAIPSGTVGIAPGTDNFAATVTFDFPDPYLYGKERTVPLTSASTTFYVDGTATAIPTVAFKASPSGGYIGLRLDNADFMQLAVTAQTTVVADCGERTVKGNNTTRMLTLDSDWFELEPGQHTITRAWGTFSGGAEVNYIKYVERWR